MAAVAGCHKSRQALQACSECCVPAERKQDACAGAFCMAITLWSACTHAQDGGSGTEVRLAGAVLKVCAVCVACALRGARTHARDGGSGTEVKLAGAVF